VSSNSIQKGVRLSTDIKGKFSDNYFDLIPGKIHSVSFETVSKSKPKVEVVAFGWDRLK
jgi:beta-mannosidase